MNHLCPYTKLPITKQNSITFTCGHSYLSEIFDEIPLEKFKCGVSGCTHASKIAVIGDYDEVINFEVDNDLIEADAPQKIIDFVDLDKFEEEQKLTGVDTTSMFFCSTPSQKSDDSQKENMTIGTPDSPIVLSDGEDEDLFSVISRKKIKTQEEEDYLCKFDFGTNNSKLGGTDDSLYFMKHLFSRSFPSDSMSSIHEMVKSSEESEYVSSFKRKKPTSSKIKTPTKKAAPRCKRCGIERKGNCKILHEDLIGRNKFICTSEKCLSEELGI